MMLKLFLLLELFTLSCNAQNAFFAQHPDEILRQVSEPSAAAVARRALRGLSIPEVIKGVYPTLPTSPRSSTNLKSEPVVEQLPEPQRLQQNLEPQAQAQAPRIADEIRVVQAPFSNAQVISTPSQAPVQSEIRAQLPISTQQGQPQPQTQPQTPVGNQAIAPPALNIRIVSSPVQDSAARRDVVDLNVLPRGFQALPQVRVPDRGIISHRPAANVNVVPVQPPSSTRLRVTSERAQTYNEPASPGSDSSDDYYDSYEFGYEIRTPEGTHSHEERKIPTGQVFGSYSMALADGRQRLVTYSADQDGFHPVIETNELGTLTSDPADAKIISSAPLPHGEVSTGTVTSTGTSRRIDRIRKAKTKKAST